MPEQSREGLRWTLARPDKPLLGHVNADVRVIGDDLPGRTLVMPVSEHEALTAEYEAKQKQLEEERDGWERAHSKAETRFAEVANRLLTRAEKAEAQALQAQEKADRFDGQLRTIRQRGESEEALVALRNVLSETAGGSPDGWRQPSSNLPSDDPRPNRESYERAAEAYLDVLLSTSPVPEQRDCGEVGEGRQAVDRAWEDSGRSALDELFEAVDPRDGSMPDQFAAGMLASHAWAEVKRLRATQQPQVVEAGEDRDRGEDDDLPAARQLLLAIVQAADPAVLAQQSEVQGNSGGVEEGRWQIEEAGDWLSRYDALTRTEAIAHTTDKLLEFFKAEGESCTYGEIGDEATEMVDDARKKPNVEHEQDGVCITFVTAGSAQPFSPPTPEGETREQIRLRQAELALYRLRHPGMATDEANHTMARLHFEAFPEALKAVEAQEEDLALAEAEAEEEEAAAEPSTREVDRG